MDEAMMDEAMNDPNGAPLSWFKKGDVVLLRVVVNGPSDPGDGMHLHVEGVDRNRDAWGREFGLDLTLPMHTRVGVAPASAS